MEKLARKGVEFHGHLGPFLIIGLRMGSLALKLLGLNEPSGLRAIVETGNEPPLSCIADGVQVATGCTLGKGNIEVVKNNRAKATFLKDNKILVVELRESAYRRILEQLETHTSERVAEEVMEYLDEELFLIHNYNK